jgi:hypothetical protein
MFVSFRFFLSSIILHVTSLSLFSALLCLYSRFSHDWLLIVENRMKNQLQFTSIYQFRMDTFCSVVFFMFKFIHVNFPFDRFDPSSAYKRAHTTLISSNGTPNHHVSSTIGSSPTTLRRSYAPMSNTSPSALMSSNTRKPRSYISSATSFIKP